MQSSFWSQNRLFGKKPPSPESHILLNQVNFCIHISINRHYNNIFNLHKFILEHRKSQIDSSVAVFFVRFIVALGKTVAAKDVFDTTGAVFARPDIQFIPERGVLIAQYSN